jgi:hypothetical protein
VKVQCMIETCEVFVEVPDQNSLVKFVCAKHTPVGPVSSAFQEYASDSKLGSCTSNKEFQRTVSKFGAPKGFQIVEGMPNREVPKWAYLKKDIQKILLTAFPKLETNPNQRQKAGRWAQIIKLYYLQGASAEEVADQLGETPAVITRLLLSIKRVSKGLTVNGCQRKR